MNYVLAFQLSAPADETCKMQTSFFITHTQEFRGALLAITFLGEVNTSPRETVICQWEGGGMVTSM